MESAFCFLQCVSEEGGYRHAGHFRDTRDTMSRHPPSPGPPANELAAEPRALGQFGLGWGVATLDSQLDSGFHTAIST